MEKPNKPVDWLNIDWQQVDKENEEFWEKQMQASKKFSKAHHDYYGAALDARKLVKNDGFFPSYNENGVSRYSIQQGLRATCHTREDVVAISKLQLSILQRLDDIKSLSYLCVVLLGYIAYKIS